MIVTAGRARLQQRLEANQKKKSEKSMPGTLDETFFKYLPSPLVGTNGWEKVESTSRVNFKLIFGLLAAYFAFEKAFRLSRFLLRNLRRPSSLSHLRGSWAGESFTACSGSAFRTFFAFFHFAYISLTLRSVVSGASYGIGSEYCRSLARRGLNIVLLARNEQLLKEFSESLVREFDVTTKICVVDFSRPSSEITPIIQRSIEGLDVSVLVNNVGITTPHPRYFEELDNDLVEQVLKVNVVYARARTRKRVVC
jgi:hypothetical protein